MNAFNDQDDGELFGKLIGEALGGLEFRYWGYFFPFLMATWRFIAIRRPGVLGSLDATFADPPSFRGRGSKWFSEILANTPEFLDREEKFMYWLASNIPEKAKARGFLNAQEIPCFDQNEMRDLSDVVLKIVDRAKAGGSVEMSE